ncbi:MAG: hypothetical protein Q7T40_02565 [Methylobacter sp.]|nr:hypothetical protein [Methylobacter sp.]
MFQSAPTVGVLEYIEQQKLSRVLLARLEDITLRIKTASAWEIWLDQHEIKAKRYRRIITEGALTGGLLAQGIPR